MKCSSDRDSPLIICVSKMFSFEKKFLPHNKARPLTHEEISIRRQKLNSDKDSVKEVIVLDQNIPQNNESFSALCNSSDDSNLEESNVFIAFARVFSGRIRSGDKVLVLGPKHNPNKIDESSAHNLELSHNRHITECQIKDLYILMGKELESVDEVGAGNILGIGGLEKHIIKSATISNDIYCPPFIDLHLSTVPILRVALEPQNPTEMPKLVEALKMLNQSDPCVEVKIQETGEHIIVTTGEVHLQRCISDLTNFSGIEINCSEPIVPFRETIINRPKVDMTNELIAGQKTVSNASDSNDSFVEFFTANKKSKIKIIAKPLPQQVYELLDKNSNLLKVITRTQRKSNESREQITNQALTAIKELKSRLKKAFVESEWPQETVDQIWSIGPKYCGTNILLNRIRDYHRFDSCFNKKDDISSLKNLSISDEIRIQLENSFVSGFQLSTAAGPLCDEPLMGVCFIAEEWTVDNDLNFSNDPFGPFSGQIMSTVKDCCRKAFQAQPQRLMAAMFSCTIQVDSDALGESLFIFILGILQ